MKIYNGIVYCNFDERFSNVISTNVFTLSFQRTFSPCHFNERLYTVISANIFTMSFRRTQ
ncbi:MAG TPA: hypothetical protein PK348_06575 [Spirochaetota bacterium]|nr:hypothetical protein [Spirochaetota bacterium]